MNNFIRDYNMKAHADIEADIAKKKDGQVTFTLRINAGNIVDYSLVEYVDVRRKYGGTRQVRGVIIQEHRISRNT